MDADNMSSSLFAEQLSQIHHMQTVSLQQKQQEVDQLQQMVQSMQGQLQLKDNEIRRLHQQQQPQVSSFVTDTPDSNTKITKKVILPMAIVAIKVLVLVTVVVVLTRIKITMKEEAVAIITM